MRNPRLGQFFGIAGLLLAPALALGGCVVGSDTTPVNSGYGYGYGPAPQPQGAVVSADVSVGEPTQAYVTGLPPEPLYEQETPSPGYGYVWLDGSWNWNGYEWGWVGGRWDRGRGNFVYVAPYYDYVGGQYVYRRGFWQDPHRLPAGYVATGGGNGRPVVYAPPAHTIPGGVRTGGGITVGGGVRPGERPATVQPTREPIARPGVAGPAPRPAQIAPQATHPIQVAPPHAAPARPTARPVAKKKS